MGVVTLWLVRLAIGLALAVGLYGLGSYNGRTSERKACEDRTAAQAAAASEAARIREQERFRANEIVAANRHAELERARAAAGAARTERDRLRDALAARDRAARSDAEAGTRVDGAAERELLGSCSEEYAAMARDADAIAGRLRGLQQYVTRVVEGEDHERPE